MKTHLNDKELELLTKEEREELFKTQTLKFDYLNQTIDECVFTVISSIPDLKKLATEMQNAAFLYENIILKGEYLILTINNGIKNEFTNFGLRIEDSQLIFDSGVLLRLKNNLIAPENINKVFQKYAENNKIMIDNNNDFANHPKEDLNTETQNSHSPQKPNISFEDFQKLDIRLCKVLSVERVENTDKLYKMEIDTGIDKRIVVSAIAHQMNIDELLEHRLPFILNLEPRKIKGIESHAMIILGETNLSKKLFMINADTYPRGYFKIDEDYPKYDDDLTGAIII